MVKRWTSLKPRRCIICNAKLGGSQRKYCSERCKIIAARRRKNKR